MTTKTPLVVLVSFILTVTNFQVSGQESNAASSGSKTLRSAWNIKGPFTSEVFIENKGQFDQAGGKTLSNVNYAVLNRGLHAYFTPAGVIYHIVNIKNNFKNDLEKKEVWEEMEKALDRNEKIGDRFNSYFTDLSAFVQIQWEGANPEARIEVGDPVNDTYSYSEKNKSGEYQSIIAHAYKKLIYKNVYPNIDIEYYFPDASSDAANTQGIKYSVVVHPGGDINAVKMKFSGMQSISMDGNGNIIAAFPEGKITDHAPDLTYAGNETNRLKATFKLDGQTVSFEVPSYDKTKTLVIDPLTSVWSISPGFTTANDGYTIRVDYNQNVYVMGGGVNMGGFPFTRWDYQVKKFDPAGVLQWTAVTSSPNAGLYGDMVVLRSGRALVGHAFGSLANAYIINPTNGAVTTVATLNEPGWRFSYNLATNNNVVWMGGGSNNGAHLYKADTNLAGAVAYHPWTTAGNTEDVCYLAQDKTGSFVYVTNSSNSNPNSSSTAPKFCKAATTAPGTAVWKVNEPTNMMEAGQCSFINGGAASLTGNWATGVNGMVVCNDRIYTYDGNNLRAYDAATGNIVNQTTTGGTFDAYSGIDVDNCCRVYVGMNGVVKRYSASLAFDATFPVSGDVYDLRFDPQNDKVLFVTGKGFVQRLEDTTTFCSTCIVTTKTDISGCSLGTGSVTVTDPTATQPLTYQWSNGATTQTISGLQPGTYTVTVTDNTPGCPKVWIDSIVITGVFNCGPLVVATGGTICRGACTNVSVTANGGAPPYTYNWNPGGSTGTTQSVCPVNSTTYTITVTDVSGKAGTAEAVVIVNPLPTVTATGAVICPGNSATINASGANTYTWQPGGNSGSTISVTPGTTTNYTVVGRDANGCSNSAISKVFVSDPPVNAGPDISLCKSKTEMLGGAPTAPAGSTFTWDPVTNLDNPNSPNPAVTITDKGEYRFTVTVTDSNGCIKSDSTRVTVKGCLIVIPNVITPGGPDFNDRFKIRGLEDYPASRLEIYDRWGLLMHETDDYRNDWDGKNMRSGQLVPDGVYYYILYLSNEEKDIYKGFLHVLQDTN